MRPFKPAPKDASANRVRERYLHRLGLQRGAPLMAPHHPSNDQVVVISGLPSLPEDRATTLAEGHVMESHDFSIASRQTGTDAPSVDANSLAEKEDAESDCGSAHGGSNPVAASDAPSHCSRSTLSVSPKDGSAGEHLRAMALAYPTALRKVRGGGAAGPAPAPPPASLWPGALRGLLPFGDKPASALLDAAAEPHRWNDGDSVSSAGTSTTAESSLTATMVSRDWGAVPSAASAAPAAGLGESPVSAPGVYFQQRAGASLHPCPPPGASSLAHALRRFNLDSDCEASSVASASLVDDHALMDVDCCDDDAASRTSVASHASRSSVGSIPKTVRAMDGQGPGTERRKKKLGKAQRLMDRAAAHERILRVRSDRSRGARASLVHAQRMGGGPAGGGQPSALTRSMVDARPTPPLAGSPCSASSLPLVHVRHGTPDAARAPDPSSCDLGRTPTASNCNADLRRLQAMGGPLPHGVHVRKDGGPSPAGNAVAPVPAKLSPLLYHPRLATRAPLPPPAGMLPGILRASDAGAPPAPEDEDRDEAQLHHTDHQASIEDVMDVALTLSRLGERTTGPAPSAG